MDWFRNLSPRGKRIAVVAGAAGLALILILASRRRQPVAPAATVDTSTAGGSMAGGVIPGTSGDLPNAAFDSATSAGLADLRDEVDALRGDITAIPALIPSPTGASDIAQAVGDVLRPIFDNALAAPVTTAPPVTSSPAPTSARPQPSATKPAATGPVGGRKVGPWDTAAKRDASVKNIPPGKVRKYSQGGKFYAEIFD